MVYMVIDATGLLPAFYPVDIYGPRALANGSPNPAYPTGGVDIGQDAWADFLAHQGLRIWNSATSTFDVYVPPAPSPPAPTVTGDALIGALTKAQAAACDVRDLVRVASNPSVPASNPKLARIVSAAGTTAAALMQAATSAF